MLSGRGLEGVVHEVEHSEENIGVVFEQFPVAGHELTSGSPVVLRIPAPTTTTTRPLGVEQGYHCFRINQTLNVNDPDSVVGEFTRQLDQAGIAHRDAGIVLVFGVSPESANGRIYAQRFVDNVIAEIPMFDTSAFRSFWDGIPRGNESWLTSSGWAEGKVDGGFRVDIYLLATSEETPRDSSTDLDCG